MVHSLRPSTGRLARAPRYAGLGRPWRPSGSTSARNDTSFPPQTRVAPGRAATGASQQNACPLPTARAAGTVLRAPARLLDLAALRAGHNNLPRGRCSAGCVRGNDGTRLGGDRPAIGSLGCTRDCNTATRQKTTPPPPPQEVHESNNRVHTRRLLCNAPTTNGNEGGCTWPSSSARC